MYSSPRITDLGRIEVHTYASPGSSPDAEETTFPGGGGSAIGLVGLVGGAIALAGRGDDNQPAALIPPDEETEKQALK